MNDNNNNTNTYVQPRGADQQSNLQKNLIQRKPREGQPGPKNNPHNPSIYIYLLLAFISIIESRPILPTSPPPAPVSPRTRTPGSTPPVQRTAPQSPSLAPAPPLSCPSPTRRFQSPRKPLARRPWPRLRFWARGPVALRLRQFPHWWSAMLMMWAGGSWWRRTRRSTEAVSVGEGLNSGEFSPGGWLFFPAWRHTWQLPKQKSQDEAPVAATWRSHSPHSQLLPHFYYGLSSHSHSSSRSFSPSPPSTTTARSTSPLPSLAFPRPPSSQNDLWYTATSGPSREFDSRPQNADTA